MASQTKAGEINKSLSQLALVIQRLTSTGSTDDPVMKMNLVDSFCVFFFKFLGCLGQQIASWKLFHS